MYKKKSTIGSSDIRKARGNSSGWAAFDLKQRRKIGLEVELDEDPFPPVTGNLNRLQPSRILTKENEHKARSFSSVIVPTLDFPALNGNNDYKNKFRGRSSTRNDSSSGFEENSKTIALKKLKEVFCWADDSLIEDIMAAADNDVEKASTLLEDMASTSCTEDNSGTDTAIKSSTFANSPGYINSYGSASQEKSGSLPDVHSTLEYVPEEGGKESQDLDPFGRNKVSDEAFDLKVIMGRLKAIPLEPEWEEDDVYLRHRKEALKMMRSASNHSKAANNAFLRGDHNSAQYHSRKARDDALAAEKLNAMAAKEILGIRNINNDKWKLDLHGLHAAEAIQALLDYLRIIETRVAINRSVSPRRSREMGKIPRSSSVGSFGCLGVDNSDKQGAPSRQRNKLLQVITGVGNHSRGQAALPVAVKSFLDENGYRFDEARPGVITVWPKFRQM